MPDESTPVDNSDDDDLLSPTPPFAPNFDPAAWRNVCESFIDPLIEELERWLQRRPPADSGTDITDWLVELTYTLYPVALGVGTDESMKRWSRAKVELEACVSLDFADRFEARIKDMFKATEAVIAEFSQCAPKHESAVIEPFLCVSVEGFLTYLDSCSTTLRSKSLERTTDSTTKTHPAPSGAEIDASEEDELPPSGKQRRKRKRPPRLRLTRWQAVQTELEDLRIRGDGWQSLEFYADEFDCGISMVRKAIMNGSEELQNWSKREGNSPTVAGVHHEGLELAERIPAENTDPIESIVDDTELALIESLVAFTPSPGYREAVQRMSTASRAQFAQQIQSMPPAEQRRFLEIYQHDPDTEQQEYLRKHPEPPMK